MTATCTGRKAVWGRRRRWRGWGPTPSDAEDGQPPPDVRDPPWASQGALPG